MCVRVEGTRNIYTIVSCCWSLTQLPVPPHLIRYEIHVRQKRLALIFEQTPIWKTTAQYPQSNGFLSLTYSKRPPTIINMSAHNKSYHEPLALVIISSISLGLGALAALFILIDIILRRGWRSMMAIMYVSSQ